jgi:hypothetical protein
MRGEQMTKQKKASWLSEMYAALADGKKKN